MEWGVHVAAQRKLAALLALLGIGGSMLLIYLVEPNPFFVAIMGVVMIGSLSQFLFPIKYRLTENQVTMRNFLSFESKEWSRYTTHHVFRDGVQLYFDQRDLRGRILKGLFLYFDRQGEKKEQILELVRRKVPQEAETTRKK
ncbi:MAG: hypothetical protein M1299_03300 [Firmicutes bacterium]|nr:hypothetical protein [Bacillota bacterium]